MGVKFGTVESELNYKVCLSKSWNCSKELLYCIRNRELDVSLLSEKSKELYKRKTEEFFEGEEDEEVLVMLEEFYKTLE